MTNDAAKALKELEPKHEFFIALDSDGCVFDTMGIKQRECFCPWMIAYFGLQPVAEAVRQCIDFAALFSKTRGANRHKTNRQIISELLPNHPVVKARNFEVPQFPYYFEWVDAPDSLLSNDGLQQAIDTAASPEAKAELELALAWSEKVNWAVSEIIRNMVPFPYVRECLEKMSPQADMIVCSSTPGEALVREWQEHDIAKYVNVIAGQEMGQKAEHLNYATNGRYAKNHALMIGDAPGDMKAAKANDALFYPINPGAETESWKRFHDEALEKFIGGNYSGSYEQQLIVEFDEYLPERAAWGK